MLLLRMVLDSTTAAVGLTVAAYVRESAASLFIAASVTVRSFYAVHAVAPLKVRERTHLLLFHEQGRR
jgi:hypothetical protein